MYLIIIYLDLPSPTGSSNLPKLRTSSPVLFGLASDGVYTAAQVTLSSVVSYTAFSPLPSRAVLFCCTFLRVTSTGRYPASCPVKPGLSSPAPFRLCSCDYLSCLYESVSLTNTFVYLNPSSKTSMTAVALLFAAPFFQI